MILPRIPRLSGPVAGPSIASGITGELLAGQSESHRERGRLGGDCQKYRALVGDEEGGSLKDSDAESGSQEGSGGQQPPAQVGRRAIKATLADTTK